MKNVVFAVMAVFIASCAAKFEVEEDGDGGTDVVDDRRQDGVDQPHDRPPDADDPEAGNDAEEARSTPAEKVHLVFKIKHCYLPKPQYLLGRFRLSATTDPPPWPIEPVGVEVPLMPE